MTATAPSRTRLYAAFAAVYFIWGSTYLAIRMVLETLPPFLTAGVRFVIAGSVIYVVARVRGAPRPTFANWKAALLLGALLLLLGNGCVMWAEQTIPSGPAALIVATEPIMIVLLQGIIPSGGLLVGLALGFAGVAVLVGPAALGGGQAIDPIAALVVVGGAAGWAAGSLLTRRVDTPRDGLLSAGMQMLAGGVLLVVLGLAHGDAGKIHTVSAASLGALAYLIVFGSIVAFTAYGYMVRNAAPSLVATYAFVNPVVAVILGSFLRPDEPLSPRVVLAALVIVAGVVIITRPRRPSVA